MPYVVPIYWLDGYVEDAAWSVILLGGYNPWRQSPKPPLQQAIPLPPKPKPKPVQRDPVRHQPVPGVRASLAYSVDRAMNTKQRQGTSVSASMVNSANRAGTSYAMKPPQSVSASLLRRK